MHVVNVNDLPAGEGSRSRSLEGAEVGGVDLSMIFVDLDPGRGPRLHRHEYPEVFVIMEGRARYTAGSEQREVGPGDGVVVPAGVPHRFQSLGDAPLRQLSLHLAPEMLTEWLEPEA
jgi:mannose-6-phosphate isomerase-like protein (cupin superfamily)